MEVAKALLSCKLCDLFQHYMELTDSKQFDWKIYEGTSTERYGRIKGKKFETSLKSLFLKTYGWDGDANTLISYYDTLSLIQRLVDELEEKLVQDIFIFMEFRIPYAENKRTDFLIAFKNTVLMLEFGKKRSNKGLTDYNEKLLQVMQYEKLIQNLISPTITTIPYVIIYDYEVNKDKSLNDANINKNNEKISRLANLIKTLYNKDTNAYDELNKLIKE